MNTDLKQRAFHRIKILKGQINGLEKSLDQEKYCPDILSLSFTIRESLKSFDSLLLENHLKTHVSEQLKRGDEKKSTEELLKIFLLSQK